MSRRIAVQFSTAMLLICGAAWMVSCAATQLDQVRGAYLRSDYALAYRQAEQLVQQSSGHTADEAAYLAGLAAYQLQDASKAQHWLRMAAQSTNQPVAGKAMAQLGLINHEQGQYGLAARWLPEAARRLTAEDQAQAYLNLAAAQQKLGRWIGARVSLRLARRYSRDPAIHRHVAERLRYSGFTLQVGAYEVEANARRAAQQAMGETQKLHLGAPRMVQAVGASGRRLFLVQISRFNDHASAAAAQRRLATATDIVPIVAR